MAQLYDNFRHLCQWSRTQSSIEGLKIWLVIGVRQQGKIPRHDSFHLAENKANNTISRPFPSSSPRAERRGFIKIDLTSSASNKMRRACNQRSSQNGSDFK